MNTSNRQSRAGEPRLKHGLSYHPLYRRCVNALARCNFPTHRSYKNYGGRGIAVCPQWQDITAFVAGVGAEIGIPSDAAELDRIDNERGYEPGNIRWVSRKANLRNQRRSVFVEALGERRTLAEWAERLGVSPQAIAFRLREGWAPDEAVSRPFRSYPRRGNQ